MKKIMIFVGLAVLLVGLPLVSKLTSGSSAKQVEVKQVAYTTIKSSILASGTLAFKEQVQLRSEVIGKAIEVHVVEGDHVKTGDPLITLDPKSYQAQVDQRSLEESLLQAKAALDQSEELLDKTRITSPIDGVVIQVDIKEDETVIAGTTNIPGSTMMVIADPSETLTEVQVDEADIAQVRLNQKADVFTAAYPDTPLYGAIQSIATVARAQPGQQSLSFLVKIHPR